MADLVHVVDDDAAMRKSLAFLLEINNFDVRLYPSALELLAALPLERGCILTDIRMPEMTGLELVRRLQAEQCDCPVIAMTGHGDVALAVEAMKAGVVDFIEKPFADAALVEAIRGALAASASPSVPRDARQAAAARLEALSPRERDVLVGVIEGKLNKVIAYELEISPRTVEIYRANLMTKTGARNMAELMRLALSAGL
jgi:two-component system, LuxR family, response regulator FixJ